MCARVTIAIPTYNRGERLDRSIASALAQTTSDIDVVVADDGSTDDTADRCARWSAADPRVKIVRHHENRGLTANFNSLIEQDRGDEAILLLSDDDWLDPDYVERCLELLDTDPALVVVAGTARHFNSDSSHRGHTVTVDGRTPTARVRQYFRDPGDGPYYGVTRRRAAIAAAPMPNTIANDWLYVGRLAAQGPVAMIDTTHIHRELGGTSRSTASIASTIGAGSLTSRAPHLVIAWEVFRDIAWRGDAYAVLGGRSKRLAIAASCAPRVVDWKSLAWHLTAPTAMQLDRHRSTRWLARIYFRITAALGADHGR